MMDANGWIGIAAIITSLSSLSGIAVIFRTRDKMRVETVKTLTEATIALTAQMQVQAMHNNEETNKLHMLITELRVQLEKYRALYYDCATGKGGELLDRLPSS